MNCIGLLREFLQKAIDGKADHIGLEEAVSDLPWERSGDAVEGFHRTIFALLWHMDAYMRDIIARGEDVNHRAPPYPGSLWPAHGRPVAESEWRVTLEQAKRSLSRIRNWVNNRDLGETLRYGPGTAVGELVLAAALHNSYHIGQIVTLRSVLGFPVESGESGPRGRG